MNFVLENILIDNIALYHASKSSCLVFVVVASSCTITPSTVSWSLSSFCYIATDYNINNINRNKNKHRFSFKLSISSNNKKINNKINHHNIGSYYYPIIIIIVNTNNYTGCYNSNWISYCWCYVWNDII